MIDYRSPDYSSTPGVKFRPAFYKSVSDDQNPVISIITPYFNTESIFAETFECLKQQSLQCWEWVIIDDGSNNQLSIKRLKEIASADPRIKTDRQDNAGPSAARNAAVRMSRGKYICLLDSDDLIEPTYLEKCVWFLESYPEFKFCNSYSVVFGDKQYLWTTGFERGADHIKANSGPPISVILRSAFNDCGGFDESIRMGHEDWDFWLAMARAGHWGYTIPEFLQWYRKRENGRFEEIMKDSKLNRNFEDFIQKRYSDLAAQFPAPTRRFAQPLEAIKRTSEFSNQLVPISSGRRVLFMIPWMVPGGADRVNLDLLSGLTQAGYQCTVCATLSTDHRWEHEFAKITSDIFVLPNFLHPSDFPRFLSYLIKSRSVDTVVIAGSTLGYQFLPYLKASFNGVAFVDLCHVEEPHWLNGGHPRFGVGYQEILDLNIVTTHHLMRWMEGRGADRNRIHVMHTGVRSFPFDSGSRSTIRSALRISDDRLVIVFAGRLCQQKRPILLIEILNLLNARGVKFHGFILGDGEMRQDVERLVTSNGLEQCITIAGFVSHGEWLKYLSASDVLLMPSKYEGISVALLEAMAAGVVPVVAQVGGQDEILPPNAGFLIEHSDDELTNYVDALTQLAADVPARSLMARNCVEITTQKLDFGRMIQRFRDLLEEAHATRVRRSSGFVANEFAAELAVQALEMKRLSEAVDWLWNRDDRRKQSADNGVEDQYLVRDVVHLVARIRQNRFVSSLIDNQLTKKFFRWLVPPAPPHN